MNGGSISRAGLKITIDVVVLVVGNTIGSAVIKSNIVCVHIKLKSMTWGCRVFISLCSEACNMQEEELLKIDESE